MRADGFIVEYLTMKWIGMGVASEWIVQARFMWPVYRQFWVAWIEGVMELEGGEKMGARKWLATGRSGASGTTGGGRPLFRGWASPRAPICREVEIWATSACKLALAQSRFCTLVDNPCSAQRPTKRAFTIEFRQTHWFADRDGLSLPRVSQTKGLWFGWPFRYVNVNITLDLTTWIVASKSVNFLQASCSYQDFRLNQFSRVANRCGLFLPRWDCRRITLF